HLDRTVELEDLLRAAAGAAPAGVGESAGAGHAAGGWAGTGGGGGIGAGAPVGPGAGRAAWEQAKAALAPAPGPGAGPAAPAARSAADPARSAAPAATAAPAPPGAADPAQGVDPAVRSTADAAAPGAAEPAPSATIAFQSMLAAQDGIPRGLGVFLKAAALIEESPERLVLELPPGPGLERLTTDAAARKQLEDALARRLGRTVALEVRAQGGAGDQAPAPPPRLTPEQVKADRLRRLMEQEPLLGRAVQEWDLEEV
ncbi:MAG TPA: hypothetical protein VIK91_05275, partial [Nannocystis sp.]